MADLKLPEIRPVGPITSAASDIERAGAQVNAAFQSLAQIPLEYDKAQVLREQTDARDIYNQAIRDALRVTKRQNAFAPEDVQKIFGNDVPDSVRLTDDNGNPRTAIPSHEVTGPLFEHVSRIAKERARQAISGEGWRKKWDEHAQTLEGEARAAALDIIAGQRAVDRRQWAVNKIAQYRGARDWVALESALKDPVYEIPDHERAALLADLPKQEITSDLYQRIDTFDLKALAQVEAEVRSNQPATNRGQVVPLSPQEQQHFLTAIQHQRQALAQAQKSAADEAYRAVKEAAGAWVVEGMTSGATAPATRGFTPAALRARFPGLRYEDMNQLSGALLSSHVPEEKDTDQGVAQYRYWADNGFRNPDGSNVTFNQIVMLRGSVSQSRLNDYLKEFSAFQKSGRVAGQLSDSDLQMVNRYLKEQKNLEPGAAGYMSAYDEAVRALQGYKARKGPDFILSAYGEVQRAISAFTRPDTFATKGAVFTGKMTSQEKDAVLDLDTGAAKSAWEDAYYAVYGQMPQTTTHLQDFVSQARESGAVDKIMALVKTTDRGAVTPDHVAGVYATLAVHGADIAQALGGKGTPDAVLQSAVDMNAAPGSPLKKAQAEAQVKAAVQGEQLREGVKAGKAQAKAITAAEEQARREAFNAKPAWVLEADSIFSKRKAKETDAVPHPRSIDVQPPAGIRIGAPPDPYYDPEEMKRYRADQATVLARIEATELAAREGYRAYLQRHNFDPDEKYFFRDALPFSAWYARWEKGEAPQ